jgi:hypothetical protein
MARERVNALKGDSNLKPHGLETIGFSEPYVHVPMNL